VHGGVSAGDTLHVVDISGGGTVTNHPSGPGMGFVDVVYHIGVTSRIDYDGIETVLA
jgi:hypothetical protein